MKYTIRNYPGGRLLEYTHVYGMKIYGATLSSLMDAIRAYNKMYGGK